MELNGVYLQKNTYSASATALQIRVYPPSKLTGYSFLPDEDDDEVIVLGDLDTPSKPSVKSHANVSERITKDEDEPHEEKEVQDTEMEVQSDMPLADDGIVNDEEVASDMNEVVADEEVANANDDNNSDEQSSDSPPLKKKPKFTKKKK
jgi:hypothetical protein